MNPKIAAYAAAILIGCAGAATLAKAGTPPLNANIPAGGCAHLVLPTEPGGTTRVADPSIWKETGLEPGNKIASWIAQWKSGGNTLIICQPDSDIRRTGDIPILLAERNGNSRQIVEVPLHWSMGGASMAEPKNQGHRLQHKVMPTHPSEIREGPMLPATNAGSANGGSATHQSDSMNQSPQTSAQPAMTAKHESKSQGQQVQDLFSTPGKAPSVERKMASRGVAAETTQTSSPQSAPQPSTQSAGAAEKVPTWEAVALGALGSILILIVAFLLSRIIKNRREAKQPMVLTTEGMEEDDPLKVTERNRGGAEKPMPDGSHDVHSEPDDEGH